MANRIQLRRDVAANWTTVNPILSQGELGIETDTGRFKIGNGLANWATLAYFAVDYADVANTPTALSAFINDSAYITAAGIPTTVSTFTNDSGYITSADIPTNVSSFTNDSLYITLADIPPSGAVAINDLTDVTITTPALGQVIKYNGAEWVNGTDDGGADLTAFSVGVNAPGSANLSYNNLTGAFTYTPPDLTPYLTSAPTLFNADVFRIRDAADNTKRVAFDTSVLSTATTRTYLLPDLDGEILLRPSIDTTQGTTTLIADTVTENIDLTAGQVYNLYKIETTAAAWVRVYINDAARIADAGRLQGVDPSITSGVIAEVITTGAEVVTFAPGINGFNDESPVTSVTPIAVTNVSGGAAAITVTITKMTLVP